ncbi:family 20 glycosylhydrolase [Arsenicibacter rosenii]|uniref:beta-N-acetylhexosaminidase n=1 Tax=Arsenicibacter rosenii TaxID=1750698 RepID=A0A1S2VPC6_9BACT|nr:family 20 glycosylhydrolase [Arsenicibacter rosenii]OIN60611.1 beta-N-acetylhexosaminidase [Arsenicibacter rosenii]
MRTFFAALLLLTSFFVISCQSDQKNSEGEAKIAVSWELLTNFTDVPTGFNARFTLTNNTGETLTDTNWKLFFNMAPRPVLANKTPQPATVQHINGDWYKLVPEKGFSLKPGASIDINYSGTEAVIKETDAPMGLYVVFYDETGKEKQIAQVGDYTVKPFVRDEQLRRGTDELEAIITPQTRYADNLSASLIPAGKQLRIIPSPFRLTPQNGQFTLTPQTPIYAAKGLENEAAYLRDKLKAITGADFTIQPSGNAPSGIFLKTGAVTVDGKTHEAYNLTIDQRGVTITGGDAAGAFYGVQSLLAMMPAEAYLNNSRQIPLGFVRVDDAPRFGFRGLHMDVSRNFQTKETILRFLDLLAFYKVNHFLFYTTEDEGWRLEIDGLPELTQVGAQREHTSGMEAAALHPAYGSGPKAYDKGKFGSGFYTKADFIEILKYAKARHIKVIPELNFPGHARAAIKAMEARYQRLMKEGKDAAANEYRLIDPDDKSVYQSAQGYKDNVVSVGRESTYRFYEKVVDEITNMYKEAGVPMDVMHAGGDEVASGAWTKSPEAAKVLRDHPEIGDPKNLQAYFFRELVKRLKKRNLTIHGWEEVALLKAPNGEYMANPEFAGGRVVPYIWNNLFDYDLGYRLANGGYPVVLCNVSNFYFDLAYNNDPKEPGLYWAGFVDTRSNWTFAPYDMFKTTFKNSMGKKLDKEFTGKVRLKPEARKNIIGVEAQLWSETIKGRDMIEYYSLPKLLGFAESAWAPARPWETIDNPTARERSMAEGWNVFANTIARKDLPRLSRLNGGYTYRLPLPGAVIENGLLKANVEYPGLTIRYTTDGSEPTPQATAYTGPVKVSGTVKLKSFDLANRSSRTAEVN